MLVKLVVDVKFEEPINGQHIYTLEVGSFNIDRLIKGNVSGLDLPCDLNRKLPARSTAKVRGNGRILSFADSVMDWNDLKFVVSSRILRAQRKTDSDNYMKYFYPRLIFRDRLDIPKAEATCHPIQCRWVLV